MRCGPAGRRRAALDIAAGRRATTRPDPRVEWHGALPRSLPGVQCVLQEHCSNFGKSHEFLPTELVNVSNRRNRRAREAA